MHAGDENCVQTFRENPKNIKSLDRLKIRRKDNINIHTKEIFSLAEQPTASQERPYCVGVSLLFSTMCPLNSSYHLTVPRTNFKIRKERY